MNKFMGKARLYKYLDFNDGLMLHYGNLQFTNATRLNDPFDCHPSLINFSNVPKEKLNPDIKIFQMGIDANAFRLNTKLIEQDNG